MINDASQKRFWLLLIYAGSGHILFMLIGTEKENDPENQQGWRNLYTLKLDA